MTGDASVMILEITRAARFGVLKILKKGMSSGTRIGMMRLALVAALGLQDHRTPPRAVS